MRKKELLAKQNDLWFEAVQFSYEDRVFEDAIRGGEKRVVDEEQVEQPAYFLLYLLVLIIEVPI